MKIDAIKKIAKQHQLKPGKANKGELIRAIQQAEGNTACFGSNSVNECGQSNCLWREDCT
ncbi:MAG: SAP domain-containing protein [Deltaproteobacteria bacterium HGW-Deltaproteobacteria-4]|nr:MAG: SAP domain-containing protein [Deltaproteobacteria bacterium HGW-Deltaproteobacteria-4]